MKRYTIYAAGIEGPEAFNMTFTLFDDFVVSRGFGLRPVGPAPNKLKKFVVITVFATTSVDVLTLRDKFAAMSGVTAKATEENITIL